MKRLKVLVVEDSEQDTALLLRELSKQGYSVHSRMVETADELTSALDSEKWDIVLSDYVMPGFSGLEAIRVIREKARDLPAIIVSGQIGEDTAVEAMKAGAQDYIIKGNLKRLGAAIEREIAEAENRRQRKKAEDELEKYHSSLEELVNQRTGELRAANEILQQQAEELEVQAEELRAQTEELQLEIVQRKEAETKAEAMIKYAPTAIYEMDYVAPRFVSVNDAMCRLSGYTREELLHLDPIELLDDNSKAVFADRVRRELAGKKIEDNVEFKIKRKDGSIIYVSLNISLSKEKPHTAFVIGHDVTEHKKAEEVKDEFIGMVSHELKTPLTVVTGALSVAMADGIPEDERKTLLQDAVWGSESMADIVDNLLELSRWQSNRLLLQATSINLSQTIQKLVDQSSKKSPRHHLLTDVSEPSPVVKADPIRVERILDNLIDNAIKYSPEGGEVKVSAKMLGDSVQISVADQGIGVSASDQEKLFQPFSRLDSPLLGSAIKGVGLGLVVCRRLVEAHGGRIWVESKPSVGSTFCFTLPVA